MNKEERMYELLKHRYDKKITTINLFEDIEALLQENEQLKEKVKYQKNKIDNKDNWCQLIADIGFDYDGCNTIESLKGLIDELVRYSLNSRDNYDYEEILKGDSLEEENKKYKNQQKEFISYLENCINELKKESMNKLQNTINLGIVDITKEILSKYKSIIGVDNDKVS